MLKKFVDAFNAAKFAGQKDENTGNITFTFKFEEFDIPECHLMISKQQLNKFRTVDVLQNIDTRRSTIITSGRYGVATSILNVVLSNDTYDLVRHQQTVQQRAAAIKAQKEAIRKASIDVAFVNGGFNNDAKAAIEEQLKGKFANSTMMYMREFANNPKLKLSENNINSYTGFIYTACCMIVRNWVKHPEFNPAIGRIASHIPQRYFKRYLSNKYTNNIPEYIIEAKEYLFNLMSYIHQSPFYQFCLWFVNLRDIQHPETNYEMTCTLEEARIEEDLIKAKAWKEHKANGDFINKGSFMKEKNVKITEKPIKNNKSRKEYKPVEQKVVIENKPKSMGSLGELIPDFNFNVDEANVDDFIENTAETSNQTVTE